MAKLQVRIAQVFARAPDSETVQVLSDLFAATTTEGRAWGEYIWLVMALRTLGCEVPDDQMAHVQQTLVDMLMDFAK